MPSGKGARTECQTIENDFSDSFTGNAKGKSPLRPCPEALIEHEIGK
jgi:hypothetical protein